MVNSASLSLASMALMARVLASISARRLRDPLLGAAGAGRQHQQVAGFGELNRAGAHARPFIVGRRRFFEGAFHVDDRADRLPDRIRRRIEHVQHQILHVGGGLKRRHRLEPAAPTNIAPTDQQHQWQQPRGSSHCRGILQRLRAGSRWRPVRGGPRTNPPCRHAACVARRRGPRRRRTAARRHAGTAAHTLPPNPAPKLLAANAPISRASAASVMVSGIWLPSSSCASRCDSAARSPSACRSAFSKRGGGARRASGLVHEMPQPPAQIIGAERLVCRGSTFRAAPTARGLLASAAASDCAGSPDSRFQIACSARTPFEARL